MLRRRVNSFPLRIRNRPEFNFDYNLPNYKVSVVPIIGDWKIHHNIDHGQWAFDKEDHGMTLIHHRPTWPRHAFWFWPVFITAWAIGYYTVMENPFTGQCFGIKKMDYLDNALKAQFNDENYHDWSQLKKKHAEIRAKKAAAEEEGEEEEEASAEESPAEGSEE